MGPLEIIVIVLASAFVAGVIGYGIYKKVTGKSNGCDCGYGCGGCQGCPHCRPQDKKEDNTK